MKLTHEIYFSRHKQTWSIAHGIIHGISDRFPNINGKLLLKHGAASIEGNAALPIESSPLNPKIDRAWLSVTSFHIFKIFVKKDGLKLISIRLTDQSKQTRNVIKRKIVIMSDIDFNRKYNCTYHIYSVSKKIKVLSGLKPQAIISLIFSFAISLISSNVWFFHRNFSSSVT